MTVQELLLGLAAAGSSFLGIAGWRIVRERRRPNRKRPFGIGAHVLFVLTTVGVGGLCIVWSGALAWLCWGYRPASSESHPFAGVKLTIEQREVPREHALYVAEVDLKRSGASLVFARPQPGGRFAATTTVEFLERTHSHLGINANFFYPFEAKSPFHYYPHSGDLVTALGVTAVEGQLTSNRWRGAGVFQLQNGRIAVGSEPPTFRGAVAGRYRLVVDGQRNSEIPGEGEEPQAAPYTRTLLGTRNKGEVLILAVVDGKRGPRSAGLGLRESADLMLRLGAHQAVEMDGGGSSTLALRTREELQARVLNVPLHTKVPFRARPVANHLALRFP